MQSKPPHEAYSVLLEACVREQKAQVASELVQWADEDGIEPSICDLLSLLASQPARKRPSLARKLLKVSLSPIKPPLPLLVGLWTCVVLKNRIASSSPCPMRHKKSSWDCVRGDACSTTTILHQHRPKRGLVGFLVGQHMAFIISLLRMIHTVKATMCSLRPSLGCRAGARSLQGSGPVHPVRQCSAGIRRLCQGLELPHHHCKFLSNGSVMSVLSKEVLVGNLP